MLDQHLAQRNSLFLCQFLVEEGVEFWFSIKYPCVYS